MVSSGFKQRLSEWVWGLYKEGEQENADGRYSWQRLANKLSQATGLYVTGETLRSSWYLQKLKKDLDPNSYALIAAIRQESIEETRAWLEGKSAEAKKFEADRATVLAYLRSTNLSELATVLEFSLEHLKHLIQLETISDQPDATNAILSEIKTTSEVATMAEPNWQAIAKLLMDYMAQEGLQGNLAAFAHKLTLERHEALVGSLLLGQPVSVDLPIIYTIASMVPIHSSMNEDDAYDHWIALFGLDPSIGRVRPNVKNGSSKAES